ncbi:biotin--[acetyl-CoA-carboxylase] ligase [Paenibacillus glufosinatiresistens]|uniref:biotin--[acetyl-CoA-carboxylase] ligase n=1 Tax=Paenibacillus glufosinatiresistens TaxID=3070657 RepID=UPI00286DF5E4|nr:biotin--[acetyl-CoA-carboxylase] ligase [Paenibacillus sp. YX.27]
MDRHNGAEGGWLERLVRLDTVISTQEEARRLAESGAPEGTAVMAEEQTGGRGRQGRRWHSPRGQGIWMSVVLRPRLTAAAAPQLTLLAGVAVCEALREVAGVEAGIKWPNDLLIGGRKVCGILLEAHFREGVPDYLIAGIGVDCLAVEEDFPEELRAVATSLRIERGGVPVDREELAAAMLSGLEERYRQYFAEGFAPIAARWEELSVTLGRRIALAGPKEQRTGVAAGLDENGGLRLVDDAGETFTVLSGEIEWMN